MTDLSLFWDESGEAGTESKTLKRMMHTLRN